MSMRLVQLFSGECSRLSPILQPRETLTRSGVAVISNQDGLHQRGMMGERREAGLAGE
jgi:hypothetical protein